MIVHEDAWVQQTEAWKAKERYWLLLYSEIGVAFEQFLLAICLVGFDQEINDEMSTPGTGTYPMSLWDLSSDVLP